VIGTNGRGIRTKAPTAVSPVKKEATMSVLNRIFIENDLLSTYYSIG
jgi:hypothetical protein